MEKYIPETIKRYDRVYVTMLLEGGICPICGKTMVRSGRRLFNGGHFPNAQGLDFDTQIKAADIVVMSGVKVDDRFICSPCATTGKASFLCCLCNKRYPTDQEEESIGDPPEYLCKSCYSTVPAKVWNAKVKALRDEHQYDHE